MYLYGQQTTYLNDTIPFHLTDYNNIAVNATLNGSDSLTLMFHTDVTSVSITPDQTEALKTAKNRTSTTAKSWAGTKDIEYIEHNTLKISDLEWNDITLWLNLLSGHQTDGKFGPHLFKNKRIEIDFEKEIMVLHSTHKPLPNSKDYQAFNLITNEGQSLFIEGELIVDGQAYKNTFMIHSGYGGTVILDDDFCSKHSALTSTKVIDEKELKDSLGNSIKTKKTLTNQFQVGDFNFEAMPYSYFDSELNIQSTSVIGCEILKRFNMILDMENLKLYLKPNTDYTTEFRS